MKLICLFETQFETQFKIDLCEALRSQQNGEAVKEEMLFLHSRLVHEKFKKHCKDSPNVWS